MLNSVALGWCIVNTTVRPCLARLFKSLRHCFDVTLSRPLKTNRGINAHSVEYWFIFDQILINIYWKVWSIDRGIIILRDTSDYFESSNSCCFDYLVGSSKNIIGGSLTSSRAIASLFFWPPLSWSVRVCRHPVSPIAIRISSIWKNGHS